MHSQRSGRLLSALSVLLLIAGITLAAQGFAPGYDGRSTIPSPEALLWAVQAMVGLVDSSFSEMWTARGLVILSVASLIAWVWRKRYVSQLIKYPMYLGL